MNLNVKVDSVRSKFASVMAKMTVSIDRMKVLTCARPMKQVR
jgi:hypothetical protein